MAEGRVKLEVKERTTLGSPETRRLRRQGMIPGVLYGRGKAPTAVCVPDRELRRVLTGSHGLHTILDVTFEGSGAPRPSILKDYQLDPVRGRIVHFDLQEVRLDQPIHAQVVIELVGDSIGAREGGVLSLVTREINVEALPLEVPERIEVDVTDLELGGTLRLSDITVPDKVKLLDDPEAIVIATVTQPTRVEEPEEVTEEGEEGAEGVPEGEQAPEGGAESPAEPGADAAGDQGTVEG
jgi:large subunit ribosomal protein L25